MARTVTVRLMGIAAGTMAIVSIMVGTARPEDAT
jgi:hypothetical protein